MKAKQLFLTALPIVIATFAAAPVLGQAGDWQVLRPEGEEFSILMPKDPVVEIGKMPYHKMELNTRLYMFTNPSGPTFAVVSMSGIKSNPSMYSDLERLNSYVDAFKKLFVSKVTNKAVVTRFVMTGPKDVNGHKGREYQVTIGDRTGTAHAFATRRRFYGVIVLTPKKDDPLREQFLSSFTLPQFVARPAETVATQQHDPENETPLEDEKANQEAGEKDQPAKAETAEVKKTEDGNQPSGAAKTATGTSENSGGNRNPISGGVLNGKALILPPPVYPAEARAANVSGRVTVQIIIDEYGNVISTKAVSGHPLLQPAAMAAAMQAKFTPTTLLGEPVKVTGILVYNFVF